jgi:hypothetical protein
MLEFLQPLICKCNYDVNLLLHAQCIGWSGGQQLCPYEYAMDGRSASGDNNTNQRRIGGACRVPSNKLYDENLKLYGA